jgi:hypothetical protein
MKRREDEATRKAQRQANGRSHNARLDLMQGLATWAKAQPQVSAEDAFRPGTVTHMCISHDDGCPTLATGIGSDCKCNPDVSYHRQPQGS